MREGGLTAQKLWCSLDEVQIDVESCGKGHSHLLKLPPFYTEHSKTHWMLEKKQTFKWVFSWHPSFSETFCSSPAFLGVEQVSTGTCCNSLWNIQIQSLVGLAFWIHLFYNRKIKLLHLTVITVYNVTLCLLKLFFYKGSDYNVCPSSFFICVCV